jgi:hypothetical protein
MAVQRVVFVCLASTGVNENPSIEQAVPGYRNTAGPSWRIKVQYVAPGHGYCALFSVQHFFPVFGHKHQMDVHIENAMSSGSNVVVCLHRPMYNLPYEDTQGI